MYHSRLLLGAAVSAFFCLLAAAHSPALLAADAAGVERGRYLVTISGCNDCHTPGYAPSGGQVDESLWLTGDSFGWRGPWGTTYSTNLRLLMQGLSEDQWLDMARKLKTRPPMPWFNLNKMVDDDLRALYRYTRYLGPGGQPAPAWVPPDQEPKPPFATFPSTPPG
jgi:mono/diheme cytochrome c family protein